MRILRLPSLNVAQFLGCASAFHDSLDSLLQSTCLHLSKLEGRPKGSAFAVEMQMDKDRYGALIVLERWADCVNAFGPHLRLDRGQEMIDEAPARVLTAENLLSRTNRLIDNSTQYTPELSAACLMACDAVRWTFRQERELADPLQRLAAEEFQETRRLFLADLAAR
ncbi:MAG: hypothetical protein FJW20_07725 [Acidimicrobiia bacterium]|nr:hypothetical protein [Acidimicrobiia bacterium]